MSIWSSRQWLTISSAASCGMMPRRPCTLRQRGLDVEVLLRAVLVGPDAAHRSGAEDVSEDGGIDDRGGHGRPLAVGAIAVNVESSDRATGIGGAPVDRTRLRILRRPQLRQRTLLRAGLRRGSVLSVLLRPERVRGGWSSTTGAVIRRTTGVTTTTATAMGSIRAGRTRARPWMDRKSAHSRVCALEPRLLGQSPSGPREGGRAAPS